MGRKLQVALVAAALVVGAGVALAAGAFASSSATAAVNACANGGNGNLRLGAGDCRANETFVSWNVAGATGPAGPAGPAGPKGDTGPAGSGSYTDQAVHMVAPSGGDVTEPLFTTPHGAVEATCSLDTDGTTGLEFTLQSTEPEAHTFSTRLGVHDYTGPQPIPIGFGNSASGRFASDTMVIAGSYGPGQWAITLTYEATTLAGGGSCWAAATATYD